MMSDVGIRTDLFTGRPLNEVSVWDFFSSVKQTGVIETPRFVSMREGEKHAGVSPTIVPSTLSTRKMFASSSVQVIL